jgi:hypothetical protein
VADADGAATYTVQGTKKGSKAYTWTRLNQVAQDDVQLLEWQHGTSVLSPDIRLRMKQDKPDFDTLLYGVFHNADVEAEIDRVNHAISLFKARIRHLTADEWVTFRKLLLAAKMHGGSRGVDGFFAEADEDKYSVPPGFQYYMTKTRFLEIRRFCVYAFATEQERVAAAVAHHRGHHHEVRSHDMMYWRRANLRARMLYTRASRRLIADERQLGWKPRTTKHGGNPHTHSNSRKPRDRIGREARNIADVDTMVELAYEPVDAPKVSGCTGARAVRRGPPASV